MAPDRDGWRAWRPLARRLELVALASLLWVPAAAGQERAAPGVEVWIERLGAPEAALRERAQRHLAATLGPDDLAPIVRTLRGADAEVKRRLVDALAADPRRLGMAALLAAEARPELRGAGEAALIQMLAAWCPTCGARGQGREALRRALGELPPTWRRLPAGEGPPAVILERLGRLGGLGVPLAIDPTVRELGPRPWPEASGEGLDLLEGVFGVFDLDLEVFGLAGERPGDATWIFVTRRGLAGLAAGNDLLLDAVRRVQVGGAEARAAALLLAASGWPAALGWLEERWLAGDESALDGLLEAAATGRVAPGLATLRGQARILERVDRALAEGHAGARDAAERTARGLAATGPLGPRGEDLDGPLLDPVPSAQGGVAATALWLRLVALEGRRGSSARIQARLLELLADRRWPALLRLQVARTLALRTPARAGSAAHPPPPEDLDELLRGAREREQGAELSLLAARLGWPPPAGLRAAAGREPASALILADWLHAAGDLEAGWASLAPHAVALEEDARLRPRAVALLRAWVQREGLPATLRAIEPDLERRPAADPLARLAARAGVLGSARQGALLAAIVELGPGAQDFAWIGHLAAGLGGAGARGLLLERLAASGELTAAQLEPLFEGLTAVAFALARSRQDDALAIFLREVRRRLAADPGHPLRRRLDPAVWPPRAAPPLRSLGEFERTSEGLAR